MRPWTIKEIKTLRRCWPVMRQNDVAAILGRSTRSVRWQAFRLGLRKEKNLSHFQKAHRPWNKGATVQHSERSKAAQFKKGHSPHNARQPWERWTISEGDDRQVWMIKPGGQAEPVVYARWRWEQMTGEKLQASHVITFRDGNSLNIADENLECIHRRELMKRNNTDTDKREQGLASWRTRTGITLAEQMAQGKT